MNQQNPLPKTHTSPLLICLLMISFTVAAVISIVIGIACGLVDRDKLPPSPHKINDEIEVLLSRTGDTLEVILRTDKTYFYKGLASDRKAQLNEYIKGKNTVTAWTWHIGTAVGVTTSEPGAMWFNGTDTVYSIGTSKSRIPYSTGTSKFLQSTEYYVTNGDTVDNRNKHASH